MDWARERPDISARDRRTFGYGLQTSRVLRILKGDAKPTVWDLTNNNEWNEWFSKKHLQNLGNTGTEGGMAIILGGREVDASEEAHNPALLSHLPYSEATFDKIVSNFSVHGSMVRSINRGHAIFSRTHIKLGNPSAPAIVYNCRSSHSWPGDIALSITYFPESRSTYAIFYGCTPQIMTEITGRLSNAETSLCHPLIIIGIFAELERKRQMALVTRGLEELLKTVSSLGKHGAAWQEISPGEDEAKHAIDPWLEIHYLKNGLENWKEQLVKITDHIGELEKSCFKESVFGTGPGESFKADARKTGTRIQERVREIICDYDEKIRECYMIMEGMTLATQLAHTKANMEIALSTKKDGSQMKSIALLTMVFLPATFAATFFSMTFFKWQPDSSNSVVSPLVWIYVVVTLGLTLFTVGLWYVCANGRKPKKAMGDEEKPAQESVAKA